jgi:AmmeMemoRadiSam system protein B
MFYPADPRHLARDIEGYLAEVAVDAAPERVSCVVCPHAGYLYSGLSAAHSYARIRGMRPARVVLLGCSHRMLFDGPAICDEGGFDTPLGALSIDETFAKRLVKRFGRGPVEAHIPEHSLEVQLPFIRVALGDVPIVPVLFGAECGPWHAEFGRELAGMLDEGDLVIASTDLSHYLTEEEANEIDQATLAGVLRQDCAVMPEAFKARRYAMCGAPAVLAAMACAQARNAHDWHLLDYRTSFAVTGDRSRVVGYGAISMERAVA